jgi:hypothetical protein
MPSLGNILKESILGDLPSSKLKKMKWNPLAEISQDEVDAEIEAAESEIDAAKAKEKAAKAAVKDKVKAAKDKIKAAKAQMKVAEEGVTPESNYTFGTGDIIKNINPKCKHFGSQGIVKGVEDMPGYGKVAIYTVTNNGDTYSPGDSLTKTIDQLAPIQAYEK